MKPVHGFLYVDINTEAGLHGAFPIIQPLFPINLRQFISESC